MVANVPVITRHYAPGSRKKILATPWSPEISYVAMGQYTKIIKPATINGYPLVNIQKAIENGHL